MLDLDLSGLFAPKGGASSSPTIEILTVCTGNICRSPLAEQVLRSRLRPLDVRVASAGTSAMIDSPMTPEAARIAASLGVAADDSAAHRGRWLTERELITPDLVIAMTREHRKSIVELSPARMRSAFTVREFERLASGVTDVELKTAADAAGTDPHARVRAALEVLNARRGGVEPPSDPAADDVIDPYRRSWETYQRSTAQLLPGLNEVTRVLRSVLH
jgi:protein-tyrosine phosphatase